ncbi:hypothetical protein [Streptomyces canus]|uniref:hypothetical protein n=1 Tax=Streptomyces canus TaxID=58343 RepID=UPI002E2F9830|nr:hypothetical protein [Streptomyces canus]
MGDDILVEDGDVAAGGLDNEVAEQGCADVDGQAAVDLLCTKSEVAGAVGGAQ